MARWLMGGSALWHTPASRRSLGHRRTAASRRATQAQGWPTPRFRPCRADRHPLRPEVRHPIGVAARRDRLWLGCALLAAPARLAGHRGLGPIAPDTAGRAGQGEPDRLGAGEPGQQRQRSDKKGCSGWTDPDRSRPQIRREAATNHGPTPSPHCPSTMPPPSELRRVRRPCPEQARSVSAPV